MLTSDETATDKQTSLKERFLEVLLASGALRFGEFVTKSGRTSPYFLNSGQFSTGDVLNQVASIYAELIASTLPENKRIHLYGPAYKGISLAVAAGMELSRSYGIKTTVTFNRKEAKDHGEGGSLIGYPLRDLEAPLVIVEDVITGGVSVRETLTLLKGSGCKVSHLFVGVDRQEKGAGERAASEELRSDFGIEVHSVLTIRELVALLRGRDFGGKRWLIPEQEQEIETYLQRYGAGH